MQERLARHVADLFEFERFQRRLARLEPFHVVEARTLVQPCPAVPERAVVFQKFVHV
jgi:hypothetical protein